MSIAVLLLGLINIAIVVAFLVFIGAVAVWIFSMFQWPIPWNVQRLFLLIVLLVALYMLAALLLGMPTLHIVGRLTALPQLGLT
jgi:hypothetical protein